MQNDKDLLTLLKEIKPQSPSTDFINATEKTLRQRARKMERQSIIKRFSILSSGVLLCTFVLSWLLFNGSGAISEQIENQNASIIANESEPSVFIYHSHNIESFIPENNDKAEDKMFSETNNVTLVGKALSRELQKQQIQVIHDDTNIAALLKEKDLAFADSYIVSSEKLQQVIKNNNVKMVFDIHRDSNSRKATTITISGKEYAKILFEVSKTSINYEKNKQFALLLHEKLEQLYPGLSRGVVEKEGDHSNEYNQQYVENSALLNIGGNENTLEETFRTTEVLAKVIKEVMRNR